MDNAKRLLTNVYKKNKLLLQTVCGVLIGTILGLLLRNIDLTKESKEYIGYLGLLYLNGLQLLALPFVIFCTIVGTAKLNISENKSIVLLVFSIFFLTTLLSVIFGTFLGLFFRPGDEVATYTTNSDIRMNLNKTEQCIRAGVTVIDSFMDLGRNLVPNNFFLMGSEQMVTELCLKSDGTSERIKIINTKKHSPNTLGLTLFCCLFGGILGTMTEHKDLLITIFTAIYEIIHKMLFIIVGFTPICVPCIICQKILEMKNVESIFQSLGIFATIFISGLLFYQLIVMQLLYFIIVRKNPFKFYFGLMPAIISAFATASKIVTIPITLKCMANLKQNQKLCQFIMPLGTMNLNGAAQFISLSVIFISQLEKIPLNSSFIINHIFTSTFMSMSLPCVPSGSITTIIILCSVLQIPPDNIALLYVIDWLLDRFRTSVNILGDCYTEAIVEKIFSLHNLDCDDSNHKVQEEFRLQEISLIPK